MATPPPAWARNRLWYVLAVAGVIALGLASRHFPELFPAVLGKYPGDTLWALMVFIGWGIILPRSSPIRIALYALATACLVEFGKLYQAHWIETIRNTTLGHLVLGSTFSWANLLAYVIGIAIGAWGETIIHARRRKTG